MVQKIKNNVYTNCNVYCNDGYIIKICIICLWSAWIWVFGKAKVKDSQIVCNKRINTANSDEKVIALVSSLLAMITYSEENSLREKGFFYITVLGHSLLWQRGHSTKKFRELLKLCPLSKAECKKCMCDSPQHAFSISYSPGSSGQEMASSTSEMYSMSTNIITTIPHRHP